MVEIGAYVIHEIASDSGKRETVASPTSDGIVFVVAAGTAAWKQIVEVCFPYGREDFVGEAFIEFAGLQGDC